MGHTTRRCCFPTNRDGRCHGDESDHRKDDDEASKGLSERISVGGQEYHGAQPFHSAKQKQDLNDADRPGSLRQKQQWECDSEESERARSGMKKMRSNEETADDCGRQSKTERSG